MKNKKLIIAIIAVALVVAAAITFNSTYKPYETDPGDTEELYRENVANAGYANTIETAMPQTEIYNAVNEHFNSELPEGKTEKKAIIIGYDGCRADILAIRDEKNSAVSSLLADGGSIKLEYCGGVNYPEINTQDTSTAPGWCSILTGQWADVHGVTGNWIPKSMDAKTLMTSLAEEEKIDSAKFITTWTGHFSKDDSTYVPEVQYCKENNLPITFKRCIVYPHTHMTLMNEVKADDCSDLVFAIYEYTDSAGHGKGFSFNNPKYQKAFLKMDAYGYDVISAIKSRETYDTEDWLIIVTSDHGGVETHHGKESIQERMTFVAMNKEF